MTDLEAQRIAVFLLRAKRQLKISKRELKRSAPTKRMETLQATRALQHLGEAFKYLAHANLEIP